MDRGAWEATAYGGHKELYMIEWLTLPLFSKVKRRKE